MTLMLLPQDRRRRLCRIGTTKPAQRTLLMIVLKPILDVVVPSQLVDASERLCVCRTLFHFIHLTIFFVFCLYLTPVHIASDDSVEKIYISVYSYFFTIFRFCYLERESLGTRKRSLGITIVTCRS